MPGNRANVAETCSGLLFSVDLGTMDGGICSGFYQATTRTGHRHGPGTQEYVAELDSEPQPIGACMRSFEGQRASVAILVLLARSMDGRRCCYGVQAVDGWIPEPRDGSG